MAKKLACWAGRQPRVRRRLARSGVTISDGQVQRFICSSSLSYRLGRLRLSGELSPRAATVHGDGYVSVDRFGRAKSKAQGPDIHVAMIPPAEI